MKNKAGKFFTPVVTVTGIILLIVLIFSLFSDYIAPYDPVQTDVNAIYAKAFTKGHFFGTDGLGRDLFSRLICSAKTSILNAVLVVLFEVAIGVPLGLICGYYRGWIDSMITRIWDVVSALPPLLLSFLLIAVMGKGMYTGVIAIGISYIPMTCKMARSLIMTEKKAVYVEACRSMGMSDARIIFVHILPNVITTMISQFTLDIGSAITSMATLSFLGLGVQAPDADWGTLLKDGMGNIYNNASLLVIPAICIIVVTVSINLFSDGIQNYPVSGHWIWNTDGWLRSIGFHDFAGGTAVHAVGAAAAFAGAAIVGPRIGKFDEKGKPRAIPGHNLTLAALGIFILWFGFNGSSVILGKDGFAPEALVHHP